MFLPMVKNLPCCVQHNGHSEEWGRKICTSITLKLGKTAILQARFTWLLYSYEHHEPDSLVYLLGLLISVRKKAPEWESWGGFVLLYCSMASLPLAWRITWMNAKGLVCWVGPHLHLKLEKNRSAAFTLPFPWLLIELNSPQENCVMESYTI